MIWEKAGGDPPMHQNPVPCWHAVVILVVTATASAASPDPFANFPASRWIEAQRARYSDTLRDVQYDVLVPPFQVEGDGLDAIGRSLIARRIAARIEGSSKLRVADPSFLELALGEPARTYSRDDAIDLARKSGARILVLGKARHNLQGQLDLDVEVLRRAAGSVQEYTATPLIWRTIPFSDVRLPEDVAGPAIEKIVATALGQPPAAFVKRRYDDMLSLPIPTNLEDLQRRASISATGQALYLHFLGELVPDTFGNRVSERLYERSLVALDAVAPDSSGYRWLRARNFDRLGRRPAALAVLGKPSGALELSLMAGLNGDLPSLEAQSRGLKSPLTRLLTRIYLADLRSYYTSTGQADEANALAKLSGDWGPLVYRRATNGDPWAGFSALTLKLTLDKLLPGTGIRTEGIVSGAFAAQRAPQEHDFSSAVIDDIDEGFTNRVRVALGQRPDSRAPYAGDILEMTQASVLENCLRAAITERQTRGRPDDAVAIIQECERSFADEPLLTLEKAQSLSLLVKKATGREASNLMAESGEATRRGFVWSGKETQYSTLVVEIAAAIFPEIRAVPEGKRGRWLYSTDFPGQPTRGLYAGIPDLASWKHCLAYTTARFACLSGYYEQLAAVPGSGPAAAAKLLAANRQRFIGSPGRVEFLANIERAGGTEDAGDGVLRQAIEAHTSEWDPYFVIGRQAVQAGDYAKAAETFLRYPGFLPGANLNGLAITNRAYDAGSLLYWAGQYEAALPLYRIAANIDNGSDASLASAARLALLDRNLELSAQISLERAQRYQDEYAYRDYMTLLYAKGELAAADALFDSLVRVARAPQIWDAALVGHRMHGSSLDNEFHWAADALRVKVAGEGVSLAPRFLFLSGMVDRGPAPDLAGLIANVERSIPAQSRDTVQPRTPQAGTIAAKQGAAADLIRSSDPLLYSRHAWAAKALTALKGKKYQDAVDAFEAVDMPRLGEFLPDYAWAAGLAGKPGRVSEYLKAVEKDMANTDRSSDSAPLGLRFDEFLARANLECAIGGHDSALRYLALAMNDRPHTETRSVPTEYRVADAAFRMYEQSGDQRYRKVGVEFARRYVQIQPMNAWAYAMVARYTTNVQERLPFLATAIYLDQNSWNATQLGKPVRDQASLWLKANRPLYLQSGTRKKSL
ncbi:MAG: hypothetical protein ABIX37_04580 [Gammaproteobacteria bacterium]